MGKKSNINKMSINDILDTVGIMIGEGQLISILNSIENIDFEQLKSLKVEDKKRFINFLQSIDKNIDKEKLIYCTAMNLKNYIRQNTFKPEDLETYQRCKINYANCLNLLRNSRVEFPQIEVIDGMLRVTKFHTMKDLLDKKDDETKLRQTNLKRLEKIGIEQLEGILAILRLDDYRDFIYYYPANFDVMDYIVGMNVENIIQKYEEEYPNEEEEIKENRAIMTLISEQRQFLQSHAEKIDIDKLLLVAAYRAKILMEREKNEENTLILTKIMQVANENIVDPKVKISGNLQMRTNEEKHYFKYSVEQLKQDMSQIFNNKYYSKKELAEAKRKILKGEKELGKIDSVQYVNLLGFNAKEKRELIRHNPKNFEYLALFGVLEKEEIAQALEEIGDFRFDIIFPDYLYKNGMIGKRDIVNMYMRGNIDLSKALDMDEMYDLKPEITVEELMQYYSQMKEDEEKTKDFDRYALLLRELNLKGKTQEQQDYIVEQIVEEIYKLDSEYSEDFKTLYKSDLLPIRTLIDWNGEEIIYDLIQNNGLKPKDAKTLLMTGELDVRKAHDALKYSKLSDVEKMNFIFSSFDGVGKTKEEVMAQNDARMYLIQAINIEKEFNGFQENEGKEPTRARKSGERKKCNQYVSDPVHRWQLFSQIDDDCTSQAYSDGTVVFTLSNVNTGTVIVEKLFKKTKNGVKINYGSATYVMSQEEFLKRKSDIEFDHKINRKVLIEMQEEGTADKLVHSKGWGRSLKENLGLSVENGYNKEKIDKIDNLIDRIEKARELVD